MKEEFGGEGEEGPGVWVSAGPPESECVIYYVVWAEIIIHSVFAQNSGGTFWLKIPIGGFLAGAVFPRMGCAFVCPFGSSPHKGATFLMVFVFFYLVST